MTSPNASLTKRLFLFAAYDKDCLIDDTLLYYLEALSKLGDIIFTMDNDTPAKEMAKLDRIPNILHASAQRHGEYDFGSYKRGYIWATDNQILDNYDWIYLANDSVLGPMGDLESMLVNIESRGADCVGMVSNDPQLLPAHIQSWFVGLKRHVATSKFFRDFITNVAHQTDKLSVRVLQDRSHNLTQVKDTLPGRVFSSHKKLSRTLSRISIGNQTVDTAPDGAFTAAGSARNQHFLPRINIQIDVIEGRAGLGQILKAVILKRNDGLRHVVSPYRDSFYSCRHGACLVGLPSLLIRAKKECYTKLV